MINYYLSEKRTLQDNNHEVTSKRRNNFGSTRTNEKKAHEAKGNLEAWSRTLWIHKHDVVGPKYTEIMMERNVSSEAEQGKQETHTHTKL